MRTVKEIEQQLKMAASYESWMDALQYDERAGVKRAFERWQRMEQKRKELEDQFLQKKAFDASYKPSENSYVAGVDEAGRGPLAGPVVTAAVILPEKVTDLLNLDDSKKISQEERQRLAKQIREQAIAYSVHIQPAVVIDTLNIYHATAQSMEKAVRQLAVQPEVVLVDAMSINVGCTAYSIVKGDEKSLAIAAASILAKTTRDAYMTKLHAEFPQYEFQRNAGYGTAIHLEALQQFGPCIEHRSSFEPVKSMLEREGVKR